MPRRSPCSLGLYVVGSLLLTAVTACSPDHSTTKREAPAETAVGDKPAADWHSPDPNSDAGRADRLDRIERSDWVSVDIDVKGPSGLAYHSQRGTLFVVSDEGYVVELDLQFQQLNRYEIGGDLEGVAVDRSTGNLYLASENEDAILEYAIETRRVLRTIVVDFSSHPALADKKNGNSGLEGVAIVPGSGPEWKLLAVIQSDPARLIELRPAAKGIDQLNKKLKKRIEDRIQSGGRLLGKLERWTVASVWDLDIDPLSDVMYDAVRQTLIVVSSKNGWAVVCTPDGVEQYRVRLPGKKPEGLALLPHGDVLVADDEAGLWRVPSKD